MVVLSIVTLDLNAFSCCFEPFEVKVFLTREHLKLNDVNKIL